MFADHLQFKDRLFELALEVSGVTNSEWFERYENREPVDMKEEPWDLLGGLSQRQFLIRISEDWIKPTFGVRYFGEFARSRIPETVNDCVFTDSGFNDECWPLLEDEGLDVICIRLRRDGFVFDSTDSRGYVTCVPKTFDIRLTEGEPEKAAESIAFLLDTERELACAV
ncbi:MAG: hypothetical protein OIF51_04645 [Cellvibrionaceae bacterium]|nr:hypothetical protein [Cellvibrionaceae bacterium]